MSDDSAWRPPTAVTTALEELDGYADLEEVGRGGDSVVYRARDLALGRAVAVKVLSVDDPQRVERFMREIEITVELGRQHPYVVTVLATGTTRSGRPAIVMDFYERGSLHDQLRTRGPLAVEEVVAAGRVVADALAFAHSHGVLHRDVKPQNVLVLPTSWVLADFGIARLVDTEHTASVETFTYRHASPQLLDGRPPFASDDPDDDSALAYLRRVRTEAHRRPESGGAEALMAVVDRCLVKDVASRMGSAAELRDALADLRTSGWSPDASASVLPRAPEAAPPPPTPTPVEPAPAPAPPPPPAEPAPVALSVLAHRGTVSDEAPTGTRPPEPPPGLPADPLPAAADEPPPDPRAKRRRRVIIGLAVLAVLLGAGLGIVGNALRGGDDEPSAAVPSEPGGQTVPSATAAPQESGPPQPKVFDPALAFDFLDIRSDGVTITMRWNDPTEGTGRFVLYQTRPEQDYLTFPPGQLEAELPIALPEGTRACFTLIVIAPDGGIGNAAQNPRCVTPIPPGSD